MAEKCMNDSADLKSLFTAASTHVKSIVANLSKQQILELYGLYKQATEGPCTRDKPRWYELTEKQKWEAWSALNDMDVTTAMEKYVSLVTFIDSDWMEKPPSDNQTGWVHHSCMKNNEEIIKDSEKTIFDWVKESNLDMVKAMNDTVDINKLDEAGLGLLHWAADRGNLDVVKYLVENMNADVNVKDENGQTPLHYAVSCEYENIEKYLIQAGADVNAKNNDGQTPYDIVD